MEHECQKSPSKKSVCSAFTEHPAQAGETYLEHLCFTLKMGARMTGSGLALFIHGFFPFLFMHTASKFIRDCHGVLDERACKTGGLPPKNS